MNNKTLQKEPYRHHYIPQFIIRNFASNDMGYWVKYYDKKRRKFFNLPTEEVFKYNDLYRDEINNPKDPVRIEKDFSRYEGEVSSLFKNKILNAKSDVVLTVEEHDSLLLFLALMEIRSKRALQALGKDADEEWKRLFKEFNYDGDLVTFWKKNLGLLVNCRSLEEVLQHPDIDKLFKAFITREAFGFFGRYLIFVEKRGGEDFLLSDVYPLVHNAESDTGIQIPLMTYFPISLNRMIISVCNGTEMTYQETRVFDKSFFVKPFLSRDSKTLTFRVRKMYERDIHQINKDIFDLSTEGIAVTKEEGFLAKYK